MSYLIILIFAAISLHYYQKCDKYAKKLKKITAIALELEKVCENLRVRNLHLNKDVIETFYKSNDYTFQKY